MTELESLLARIVADSACEVLEPCGLPRVRGHERVPDDLVEFYRLTGGVVLHRDALYPFRIVTPDGFVRANPEIAGVDVPDDISDSWYVVARSGAEEVISLDCGASVRSGRCYDSFWDRHALVGDCRVVALSFTELLKRLYDGAGQNLYWLSGAGPQYGDAYDDV